jgi:hypothetical protein
MNAIMKPAAVLGLVAALSMASLGPSEARARPWVAAGLGFAAGALVGSAAAANAYSYDGDYGYAYAYAPGYAYAPAYAYEPYVYATPAAPSDTWRYSRPWHGYDTNYVGPLRERVLQGNDY